MAEILVKAVSFNHPDSTKDRVGAYKRGMFVLVMPDGHAWGLEERLPKFVVVKVPLISVARVSKYIAPQMEDYNSPLAGVVRQRIFRRRRWILRWADLPAAAQNTLATTGQYTIKATAAYNGPFDATWAQVKAFFRDQQTGLDETEDL